MKFVDDDDDDEDVEGSNDGTAISHVLLKSHRSQPITIFLP